MQLKSGRFGTIEVEDGKALSFPKGLLGFPEEQSFILLRPQAGSPVRWLQSVRSPALSFPVVSVESLMVDQAYVDAALVSAGHKADAVQSSGVMVVLTAPAGGNPATVNLLAPIVVNADTRTGAQVIIEGTPYTTKEPFVLRAASIPAKAATTSP